MTWYLTLRPPARRPEAIPAQPILDWLAAQPELRQVGPAEFDAADGQPWVHVIVADGDANGNYATGAKAPERVNIVELICAYERDEDWYEALALRIAAHLGWEAFEESIGRRLWVP
ncbi:hypothetical protein [Lysobacter enzymogenes]|uniref:hypothetical protein n=1 Tax=Lysobacter enzymogenes TaxID=69 RepID=UPI001A96F4FF|nr:hypothetical protein [Lysobacter enzymogenes]QQP94454.1 hypothetical protein JHW38_14380 [Lysobacter enzymogenes]